VRRLLTVLLLTVLTAASVPQAGAAARGTSSQTQQVEIATLPAYADYPVILDGHEVRTDAAGVAHFEVAGNVGGLTNRLILKPKIFRIHGVLQRVEPARFQAKGRYNKILFNVFYQSRFTFKNSNGGPLDNSAIHELTVKNSIGAVKSLAAHEPTWLQGSRVVPLAGGLEVKKLYWTVQDVQYAGTSVVNSSQQRFLPADTQDVQVSLLFYSARLRVHDALFGFRRGGSILLIYPDQTQKGFSLQANGSVLLPSLPRGNYSVVLASMGPRMTQQIAISTNQDLDLKYYGWIDIAVIGLVTLFFTVGLLWIGVRRRRTAARRRIHAAASEREEAGKAPACA
jgi:hypothetical protein